MPTTVVNTAGTIQLKVGPGYIRQIIPIAVGTGFAFKLNDGPIGATNSVNTLVGAGTPVTVPAQGVNILPQGLFFSNGIQLVTSGTPGEFEVDWY